jgi:mannose-6-phosphate isomerase-like protein (cupin superfamily)
MWSSAEGADKMEYSPIKLREKFAAFNEQWSPRIIAEMNDYQFKLARLEGEFVWHDHPDTDEAFLVIDGEMVIEFRDGKVTLAAGEMFVVPKGVEHRPVAEKECQVLLIEPRGVVNTGSAGGELTADNDVWI